MKIKYITDEKFIIYLNKYYYVFNKSTIDECISKILKKLKKKYNIDIYETFNIDCYICDNYGIILEIKKESNLFSKYSKTTDININYYNSNLLFLISDYFIKDNINCNIYTYENRYYIELKEDYKNICEFYDDIVYGNLVKKIKNNKN